MAVLDIECNVKNLAIYFNRDTFVEVTNDIKYDIKPGMNISREIMNKYFKKSFKNELIFRGNLYSPKYYLSLCNIVIFDNYTSNLFLGVKSKTLVLDHQKPKKIKINDLIIKAQKIKGIVQIERDVINTLKFFFPIDAYKREWIVDLDYGFYSDNFDLAKTEKDGDTLKFATLIKDQMVILYADDSRELINKLQPTATYRSGNPKVMKLIPSMIKKGDNIAEIFVCDRGIAIKKETGVVWFVLD